MILLRFTHGRAAAASLAAVKLVATRFPGTHALTIEANGRRLTIGEPWRYEPSEACLAALREFGDVEVVAPDIRSRAPGAAPSGEHERPEGGPSG